MYIQYDELLKENVEQDLWLDSAYHLDGLYWDEACTQAITTTDKCPSYDTTIYAKVSLNDGYALVNITYELDGYSSSTSEATLVDNDSTYTLSAIRWDEYQLVSVTVDGVEQTLELDGSFVLTLEADRIYEIVATYDTIGM